LRSPNCVNPLIVALYRSSSSRPTSAVIDSALALWLAVVFSADCAHARALTAAPIPPTAATTNFHPISTHLRFPQFTLFKPPSPTCASPRRWRRILRARFIVPSLLLVPRRPQPPPPLRSKFS